MLQSLISGDSLLGYNVLATYARSALRDDASVGFVYPRDASARFRPIAIGPGLMAWLDRSKRQDFLRQWRQALSRQ